MERCRVLRIEEQMYGCEELPEGAEVCCDVTVEAADGTRKTLSCPDAALIRQGIGEGDRVLWDGMELKKERNSMKKIETSALIGLGALGILFGRKMPGVKVIADAGRIARYSAQPVVCNGEECHFDYVTPEQGQPVDLLLVAVKATVLEQAIRDMKKFIGPDTIILSVLNGITSEEDIEAVYPGHCLWSVAIGMDATRVGRSLTFGAPGRIQFGEKNGEMTDRVRAVDEYLTACGIASEPCSDILFKQWSKLMVNDGLNQAAAAFDLPYGGLTKPGPAYDKMLEAMQEVIDLSVLEGVNALPITTRPSSSPWPPPSSPTGCPVCGRMSSPSVPPRWRSLRASSAVWRKSTGCPPRPMISSTRRSGRSRPDTTRNKEMPCTTFISPVTARRSGTSRIRSAA